MPQRTSDEFMPIKKYLLVGWGLNSQSRLRVLSGTDADQPGSAEEKNSLLRTSLDSDDCT